MIKDAYGNTRFYGVYRGIVVGSDDPLGRKRLKLKVPQILADNVTEWAWPSITPGTAVILPSVGDGVWVMFEGGDASFPVWNGSFNELVPTAATNAAVTIAAHGIPDGGTAGQLLAKIDDIDYNVEWINEAPAASYTSTIKHEVKLGESISKGQAVYVSSADGTNIIVSKASNATEATSSKTMGLLETGGSTNAKVNVITEGLLAGLNTSTATAGDPVWLGTSGNLIYGLTNKPTAPSHLVFIGVVTRSNSNNGEIFVRPQNGFELNEIHNVLIGTGYSSTPSDNDLLAYDSESSLWKNQTASQAGLVSVSDTGTVTSTMIADGTIVNADISASAAISATKISGTAAVLSGVGLVPMIPTSVSSGVGTTSFNSTNGLVTFTSVDYIQINGVFTSSYRNYLVIFEKTNTTASSYFVANLSASGTINSVTTYDWSYWNTTTGSTVTVAHTMSDTSFGVYGATGSNAAAQNVEITLYRPQQSSTTAATWKGSHWVNGTSATTFIGNGNHGGTNVFDGIRFTANSPTTPTGVVKIYGFN